MIILPRLDEIFLFNLEPGRKEQGSRCWRCWTRPLGSRCPRSCLSSSPGQDIVQKWDIEAVSRRLLARSHLNVLHLDTLHLFFSSHLDVLQALASQLAAQSLCQLVAKVSRAPLQKEEKQNCKSSGKDKNTKVTTTEMLSINFP